MPQISEAHHQQLQSIADSIRERKKSAKEQQILFKSQMASMGTLDHADAGLLGIPVEQYKLVKDHPKIIEAIAILDAVELIKVYPNDEAAFDSRTTGVPVETCKRARQQGIDAEKKKAHKLVADALSPPKQGPKPKAKTAKQAREADLRTWVNPPVQISNEQVLEAVKIINKPFEKLDTAEDAKVYFENMATKRAHPGRIIDFQVTIKPGTSCFRISIKRENGLTIFTDNPDLFDYGFSEWTEMKNLLEAKLYKNRFDKAWLSVLKRKFAARDQAVQRLQEEEEVQPLVRKRKATEQPSRS